MPDANPYWKMFPWTTRVDPTDVCDHCGHVRSLHHQYVMGVQSCVAVSGCDCGPYAYAYRMAQGPRISETIIHQGKAWPISQPKAPGNSLPGANIE